MVEVGVQKLLLGLNEAPWLAGAGLDEFNTRAEIKYLHLHC
jgi:hypothetical protein